MREHLGWAAALALALALLVATPLAASGTSSPAAGPGCTGLAAPIAHRSGVVLVTPPPPGGPRACGVSTGFAAAESHIVAMKDGAVDSVPHVVPSGVFDTGCIPRGV